MGTVGAILQFVLEVFFILMIARLVFSYVQMFARSWTPSGPILVVLETIFTITDPPLRLVRRYVPPLRLGAIALDTSFIIVIIAIYLLQILVGAVFFG